MSKGNILKWTALLLIGPAVGVTGAVLYEHNISRDTSGLLAGIGWITAAVVTSWLTVKLFRSLPVRYSKWAMIAAIPVAVVSTLLHGVVYAITGAEEPFFFILAIFGAPLLLIGGVLGVWPARHRHPPAGSSLVGT